MGKPAGGCLRFSPIGRVAAILAGRPGLLLSGLFDFLVRLWGTKKGRRRLDALRPLDSLYVKSGRRTRTLARGTTIASTSN